MVSDAIDRVVNKIDFRVLADKDVYFDTSYLKGVVDERYLISSLRQSLLASGCILNEKREDATYVVEPRAGVIGTDRYDLLYGVPATNLPSFLPVPGLPSSIPEIPFAKRTNQRGVAKIAVFAYNRKTGMPVWQSGIANQMSSTKDIWLFGAGPFQRGTIYKGTAFAGQAITNPLAAWLRRQQKHDRTEGKVNVGEEKVFAERPAGPHREGGPAELAGKPKVAPTEAPKSARLEPLPPSQSLQTRPSPPIQQSIRPFPPSR